MEIAAWDTSSSQPRGGKGGTIPADEQKTTKLWWWRVKVWGFLQARLSKWSLALLNLRNRRKTKPRQKRLPQHIQEFGGMQGKQRAMNSKMGRKWGLRGFYVVLIANIRFNRNRNELTATNSFLNVLIMKSYNRYDSFTHINAVIHAFKYFRHGLGMKDALLIRRGSEILSCMRLFRFSGSFLCLWRICMAKFWSLSFLWFNP